MWCVLGVGKGCSAAELAASASPAAGSDGCSSVGAAATVGAVRRDLNEEYIANGTLTRTTAEWRDATACRCLLAPATARLLLPILLHNMAASSVKLTLLVRQLN